MSILRPYIHPFINDIFFTRAITSLASKKKDYHLFFILLNVFFLCQTSFAAPSKNYFPVFPAIKPNVTFWENIYSHYGINTVVLHDSEDLSIIYEKLTLLDSSLPGAARINKKYKEKVKNAYKKALKRLANGNPPRTRTEKKIAAIFSKKRAPVNYFKASENLRFQRGLRERFEKGVITSGRYIGEIKKILRQYHLPTDLAYLPHVESSYNVHAYSRFGATGIWQFTTTTGKQYLTIDYIIDERRDPIKATHAAAKYLSSNLKMLGSWPLAITAYNHGHYGMQRAQKEWGTYVNIFKNYRKGHFKFSSRNFYSEFIAAVHVAKKIEQRLAGKMDKPEATFLFHLKGFIEINALCNYFNLSKEELQHLNMSLRKPVLRGEKYVPKGFKLRLPSTEKTRRLAAAFPHFLYKKAQKRSQFYIVKRGDTAGKIAKIHNISLKSLRRANNLNKHSVVYIGQKLRIPLIQKAALSPSSPSGTTLKHIPVLKNRGKRLPGNK